MISLVEAYSGLAPGYYGMSLPFTGTSEPIMIKSGMTSVSVAIHPAVGQTARVEFTLSCQDAIDAGTAKWMSWPQGNVSVSANDAMRTNAYAVRGVSSGGTATLEVLAK
jgi:hypothetical protein